MDGGHGHDHGDLRELALTHRKRLAVAGMLGILVMVGELTAGRLANSLVLLADGAHYLTDVVAIGIAFYASSYGMRAATASRSFGHRRAEVLAALANAALLAAISVYFVYASVLRILHPATVSGSIVIMLGTTSLVVNGILARLLHASSR